MLDRTLNQTLSASALSPFQNSLPEVDVRVVDVRNGRAAAGAPEALNLSAGVLEFQGLTWPFI
jgi:hypothetical protein